MGKSFQLLKNVGYALAGLRELWKRETSFRIEVGLVGVGVVVALLLPVPPFQKGVLIGSGFILLGVEGVNSAIEAVTDLASGGRYHQLAKIAKDMASAAVLLVGGGVGVIWIATILQTFF
jgi:diacylglycerol kinase (ATP)